MPSIWNGALAQDAIPSDSISVAPDTVVVVNLFGATGFWMTRNVAEGLYNTQRLSPVLAEALVNYRETVKQDSLVIIEQGKKIGMLEGASRIQDDVIVSMQETIQLYSKQAGSYERLYKKERLRRRIFTGVATAAVGVLVAGVVYGSVQ